MALAQTTPAAPAPAAPAAKQEEVPFWAIGRPKAGVGAAMAPVAAPPVPTPADKLPQLKVPQGFKVEVFQSGLLDARGIRRGDKGTIFVSTLFVGSRVYAITGTGANKQVKTIIKDLPLANGIEFHNGALYVATPKEIWRYDNIEANLDNPPKPVLVTNKLPGDIPHGWKFIKIADNKIYVPIGAPCNICDAGGVYSKIHRMNLDGSGMEVVAEGVRNTVGFDFHPRTKQLWFTNNERDWLSEDLPLDKLAVVSKPGEHFGYPYCHPGPSGLLADGEFGWGKNCKDYTAPAATLGAHMAPLGMRFYTGKMFPAKYQGAVFIARHGPWNRSKKEADVSVAFLDATGKKVTRVEPFLTGFVKDNAYVGRPVDVHVLPDGSMLVSDDHAGAVYRVSYGR
jgi:glucose/arabinose dehydrogenase